VNRHARRAAASAKRGGSVMPEPNPLMARAAEHHRQVLGAARKVADEGFAADRAPRAVYDAVDAAVGFAEAIMRRRPTDASSLACKRGCAHCCHRPVGVSAAVVLRIAAALREHASESEFADILARVVSLDEKTHGARWTPSERPPHPCAFLLDGACRIYPIRPFVCRAWNSADEGACRRALGEDALEMRFDLFQRTTYAAAEQGLKDALEGQGLDAADLELTAAVRVALENQDACERWVRGERIFAGCEAKPDPRRRLPLA
jgi:Fe-S-cluster containining protein